MQFSTVAIFAAVAATVSAANATVTDYSSVKITITSCAPTVTDCPVHTLVHHNYTSPVNVTATFVGGASPRAVGAAAAALAAGALLAL